VGHVRQDLVQHAEEAHTDASIRGEEVDTIMKAAVAALKEFDGKQPCEGNIYIKHNFH
jgi:hypothetical protein